MQPPYKIRVVSLRMQESGTYNPMFERPIITDVRSLQPLYDLSQRFEYDQVKRITPASTAGIASTIVAPSAVPGAAINIMNGWDTRRIRFVLHVALESNFGSGLTDDEYFLQGFTDYAGVSINGTVDPRMLLVINSFVKVGKEAVYGPDGIYERRVIRETAQVINGDIIYQSTGYNGYGLRPRDAFMGLQSIDLYNAQTDGLPFYDKRYQLNNKAVLSNKYHTTPAAYLASFTDSYFSALMSPSANIQGSDLYERSKYNVGADNAFENPFFRRMKTIIGHGNGTVFSIGDLEVLDPGINNVTVCAKIGPTSQMTYHKQGDTEYWSSALYEAQWATILGNGIPALLMELMVSRMTFLCTNKTTVGYPIVTIIDAVSITGADVTMQLESFKQRIIQEVMNDISRNNLIPYEVSMTVDVFGETIIDVSIENNPSTRFCIPTFIDSITTPMITANKDIFYNTINDLGTILSTVSEGIGHDYGSVNSTYVPGF